MRMSSLWTGSESARGSAAAQTLSSDTATGMAPFAWAMARPAASGDETPASLQICCSNNGSRARPSWDCERCWTRERAVVTASVSCIAAYMSASFHVDLGAARKCDELVPAGNNEVNAHRVGHVGYCA